MTVQTVGDITSFKWATVTGVSPLAIRLDGDTSALALIPDSLVDPASLTVGDRVRVELSLRKVVVHGKFLGSTGPDTGDVPIVLNTGWTAVSGTPTPTYRVRHGVVSFNARVSAASGVGDATMFVLPTGARPSEQLALQVYGDAGTWFDLVIATDGVVTQFGRGTASRYDVRMSTIPPFPAA